MRTVDGKSEDARNTSLRSRSYLHSASTKFFRKLNLIERNPPPRKGFLFTMFPHQEPGGRRPRLKNHPQNGSILRVVLQRGCPLPPGSWWGNILFRKPPRGGGVLSMKLICREVKYSVRLHSSNLYMRGIQPIAFGVSFLHSRISISILFFTSLLSRSAE